MPARGDFEAELTSHVALYDAVELLPRSAKMPFYRSRDPYKIQHLLIHKSGANGPAGFEGMRGSAEYFITSYKGKGAPGFPYTFWISREPDSDEGKRLVVYRGNHDETWSWHSGSGMNEIGVAICVQGNFDGDGGLVQHVPTEAQLTCLEALVTWCADRYRFDCRSVSAENGYTLTGHWEHGKPVCPGDYLRAWVERRRGSAERVPATEPPSAGELDIRKLSIAERKKVLCVLAGKASVYQPSAGDDWTYGDRGELTRFQAQAGLKADGWWGPQTARALLRALRERGFAQRSVFVTL